MICARPPAAPAHLQAVRNRRSGAGLWDAAKAGAVTWCNCHERFTVVLVVLLGPRLAQHRGLSPSPGGARWPPRPRPPHSSPVTPVFANTERLALAGFLVGYSGLTRQAYELDLRQYAAWCQQHQVRLFAARRADIECFARDLEARGRARATITRRLCTVAGFYRYASKKSCTWESISHGRQAKAPTRQSSYCDKTPHSGFWPRQRPTANPAPNP
jgi:Phage integrase, N-terminal SAM-like domain